MRRIWALLSLQIKAFFKSPGVIMLMFVMPLLFSFIFGGIAMNSGVSKPVVNIVGNSGKASSEITSLLKKNNQYTWKMAAKKQAQNNVATQDTVAAVVIPKNIEQRIADHQPVFDIMVQRKNEDYLALVPHLEGTARLVIRSYQISQQSEGAAFPALLKTVTLSKGIKIDKETIQKNGNPKTEINLMFVGFAIMFMMFGLSGAASTILDERAGGTWGRLMITPISRLQVTLGYLLAYFLMGWIQLIMLMSATKLIFGTDWGNFIYLIPFASLVILCVVGFGLMIAGLVKTKQQAAAIGAVLIVSTCMLGGVYWSIDLVPDVMQKIALAVPQSWAMAGLKEIISGNLHPKTLLEDTLALIGFTALFFIVGLNRMKFE